MELSEIFDHYGNPSPADIQHVAKGSGPELAYIGHGTITKWLTEIDPEWTWEPLAIIEGEPAIQYHTAIIQRRDGTKIEIPMASMWGRLTLRGVTRIAVGTCEANKPDRSKELASDLIRNGAMRFGVALGLWMGHQTPNTPEKPAQREWEHPSDQPTIGTPASEAQIRAIFAMSKKLGKTPPIGYREFTKQQAHHTIEQLDNEIAGKNNEEAPF